MRRPELSVIIPAYNREGIIGACLRSVLQQTLAPTEVVVVDDGSTDSTAQVVESLRPVADERDCALLCLRQSNQGKSAALNHGCRVARGQWIAFNDSDDLWHPEKNAKQFAVLERNPDCEAVFSDCRYVNDPSLTKTTLELRGLERVSGTERLENSALEIAKTPWGIFMQSLIVSRRCMEAVFPIDARLRVGQDLDLLYRFALETDYCYVHEPLVDIDRSESTGQRLTKEHSMKSLYRLQMLEKMIEQWSTIDHPKTRQTRPHLKKRLSDIRHMIGKTLEQTGNQRDARAYHLRSLRTRPSPRSLARCLVSCALSYAKGSRSRGSSSASQKSAPSHGV